MRDDRLLDAHFLGLGGEHDAFVGRGVPRGENDVGVGADFHDLDDLGQHLPLRVEHGHAAALLPHVERRLVGRHPDAAAVMAGDLRSHLGGLHVDRVAVVPVERDPAEYLDAGHRGPQQIGDVVGDEIVALVHDPAIAVLLALPGQRQLVDATGPDIGIGMYVHFDHAVEILVDGGVAAPASPSNKRPDTARRR